MPVGSYQFIFDANQANARISALTKQITALKKQIQQLQAASQNLNKGGPGGKGGVFGAPPGAAASFFRTGARGAKQYGNAARGATQAQFQFMSAIQDVAIVMQGGGTFDRAILGAANNFGFLAAMMPGLTGLFATLGVIAIPTVVRAMTQGGEAAKEYANALTEIQDAAQKARNELVRMADQQKRIIDLKKEADDLLKEPEEVEAQKKIREATAEELRGRLREDPGRRKQIEDEIRKDVEEETKIGEARRSAEIAAVEARQEEGQIITRSQREAARQLSKAGITGEARTEAMARELKATKERIQQIKDMVASGKELKDGTEGENEFARLLKNAKERQKNVAEQELKTDERVQQRRKQVFGGDLGALGEVSPDLGRFRQRVVSGGRKRVAEDFATESRRAIAGRAIDEKKSEIQEKIDAERGRQVTSGSERFMQQQQIKSLQQQLNALNRLLEEFKKSNKNQEELNKFMKQLEGLRGAGVSEHELSEGERNSFDKMHPAERALNDAIVAGTGGAVPK